MFVLKNMQIIVIYYFGQKEMLYMGEVQNVKREKRNLI